MTKRVRSCNLYFKRVRMLYGEYRPMKKSNEISERGATDHRRSSRCDPLFFVNYKPHDATP